jgi:phage protein U
MAIVGEIGSIQTKMFAQLGSVQFNVFPIDGFEERFAYAFAEHQVIEGKPRLQFIGDNLDETTIGLRWHVNFCDPLASWNQLKAEADKHQALNLVFGDGSNLGRRVITELCKTLVSTADNGRPICIEARATLREYFDDQPLATLETAKKIAAPGLAGTGPIGKAIPAPGNKVAAVAGEIKAQAAQIKKDASLMSKLVSMLASGVVSLMKMAGPILAQMDKVISAVLDKVGPILDQVKVLAQNAQAAAGVIQGYARQIQGYATMVAGFSSQIARITSGLPAPLNKVGNRISALNSSISSQATKTITLSSLVQGDAIEAGTRAQMICRMLPK